MYSHFVKDLGGGQKTDIGWNLSMGSEDDFARRLSSGGGWAAEVDGFSVEILGTEVRKDAAEPNNTDNIMYRFKVCHDIYESAILRSYDDMRNLCQEISNRTSSFSSTMIFPSLPEDVNSENPKADEMLTYIKDTETALRTCPDAGLAELLYYFLDDSTQTTLMSSVKLQAITRQLAQSNNVTRDMESRLRESTAQMTVFSNLLSDCQSRLARLEDKKGSKDSKSTASSKSSSSGTLSDCLLCFGRLFAVCAFILFPTQSDS